MSSDAGTKLVVAGIYPPDVGGPATYAVLLEQELPKRGIDVVAVPFGDVRSAPVFLRHAWYFWKLFWATRAADVLLVQDTVSCGLPALLAARCARRPFIVRVPGDYAWEQGVQRFGIQDTIDDFQDKRYGFRVEVLRRVQRFVVCHADRVIVPSNYFHNVVEKWGVTKTRLSTVYNGIDFNVIPTIPNLTPGRPFMVSVGRLVPWKGFLQLIHTIARLPDWHLVIVGDGPDRAKLEDVARNIGVGSRIHFTGSLSRAEVFGWLTSANAFVLNTSFESFSFQVVEAMYCGVPIITTHIGSLPELLCDPEEGLLVTPNDEAGFITGLQSVLSDPAVWESRVLLARRKSKQFSISETINHLSDVIKSVVR